VQAVYGKVHIAVVKIDVRRFAPSSRVAGISFEAAADIPLTFKTNGV
jgi:hypothetical protein